MRVASAGGRLVVAAGDGWVDVEKASGGQCAIDVRYGELVPTADNVLKYKYIVRNVARRHGKTADELLDPKLSDTNVRTIGLRSVLGEIDRAMPNIRKEVEEIDRLAARGDP